MLRVFEGEILPENKMLQRRYGDRNGVENIQRTLSYSYVANILQASGVQMDVRMVEACFCLLKKSAVT